jgi:hypothetical protein
MARASQFVQTTLKPARDADVHAGLANFLLTIVLLRQSRRAEHDRLTALCRGGLHRTWGNVPATSE